jgi:hypothetical protein
MISVYFAVAGGGGWIAIAAFISITWLPSHYIFKWLYKNHRSDSTFENSIYACFLLSASIIFASIWLGNHSQALINLAKGDGGYGANASIVWLLGLFWAVGVWGGFATGYMKERIIK